MLKIGRMYRIPRKEVLAMVKRHGDQVASLREWLRALGRVAGDPLPGNLEAVMGELRDLGDDREYTLADLRAQAEKRGATEEGLAVIDAAAVVDRKATWEQWDDAVKQEVASGDYSDGAVFLVGHLPLSGICGSEQAWDLDMLLGFLRTAEESTSDETVDEAAKLLTAAAVRLFAED